MHPTEARALSVLVVSAAPDRRQSTSALRQIVSDMRCAGAKVTVWFLRDGDGPAWPGERVVDHLRTGRTAALGRRLKLEGLAAHAAGARLRWWYARAKPDLVVLDDGIGGRVLPTMPGSVAVRENDEAPDAPGEPRWDGPTDIVIAPQGRPTAPIDDRSRIVAEWPSENVRNAGDTSRFLSDAFGIDPTRPLVLVELPIDEVRSTGLVSALIDATPDPIQIVVIDPTARVGDESLLRSIPGAENTQVRPAVPGALRSRADLILTHLDLPELSRLLLDGVAVVGPIPAAFDAMATASWSEIRADPVTVLADLLAPGRDARRDLARERILPGGVGPALLGSIRRRGR